MILYHYTSIYHLLKILKDGHLKTTESNASSTVEHFAKDVVWLTSKKDPQGETSIGGGATDKKKIRITMNSSVPAIRYIDWAEKTGVSKYFMECLNEAGGHQMQKWHVIERPIQQHEWKQIDIYDYDKNKWIPYSKGSHNRLLGKILVEEQNDQVHPVDARSELMLNALKYLSIDPEEYFEVVSEKTLLIN